MTTLGWVRMQHRALLDGQYRRSAKRVGKTLSVEMKQKVTINR